MKGRDPGHPLGRRFALPLAGSSILLAAASGGLELLIQLFLKDRGAATILISSVASLGSAGVLVGSLFWGHVSDRTGRRALLVVTALGAALATALMIPLPSDGVVLGSAFLRSFMEIGFVAVALTVVSAASIPTRRGKNLSYITSARALGFAVGTLGAGLLLESLAFSRAFLAAGALSLLAIGFMYLLPREPRRPAVKRPSARAIFRSAGLTDLYLSTVLRQVGVAGAYSLLYVHMATLGIQPATMGWVSGLNRVAQVGALVAFGWVVDRVGRRRVFMSGFALSVLIPLLVAFSRDAMGMAVAYVLIGLSYSALYIGSTAHIGDTVPQEQQGTMLGLYETSRGLGGFIGPIIAGAVAPSLGFRGMFLTMSGIAAVGFLIMFVGRRRPPLQPNRLDGCCPPS